MLLNPHTPNEIARWLQGFGHAWGNESLRDIDAGRAAMMDGSEAGYRAMVESFQRMDANVELQARNFHGRPLQTDGKIGPATVAVMSFQRCPLPDFAPPPGVSFGYDDPDIQRAVESMQLAAERATGSGSWPFGCYENQLIHEVTISYDASELSEKQRLWLPELKARAVAAYAAAGVLLREVPLGERANIRFYGQRRSGSIIGVAEFNSESCGDSVFCTINPTYAPDLVRVLVLILHELGHNMNLQHRSGNIMNPSLLLVEPHWVKRESGLIVYQDNSYPTLKKYFGPDPVVIAPQPPPVDPTQPIDPWFGAVLTLERPGHPPQLFFPPVIV